VSQKQKTPVSFPTEAFVFFCFNSLSAARRSSCATEFRKLCRVAYLGDEPGLRRDTGCRLFLDDPANRSWPVGDRVTSLCHSNVVLPPVLAEEQSFFTLEQACQVQAADRHVYLEFHRLLFFPFFFSVEVKFRAPIDDRQVT
jgi:hypothetical protein